MSSKTLELKQFVEKQPWTAVSGAALVGFAFGSGMAVPILVGAGMSRGVLGSTLKGWLAREVEQGLRNLFLPKPPATRPEIEDHSQTDSGAPGDTSLSRRVQRELGY